MDICVNVNIENSFDYARIDPDDEWPCISRANDENDK